MIRHTLKILQQMLQDFKSVSDHFTTLRSKGLMQHKIQTFYCVIIKRKFLKFLKPLNQKMKIFSNFLPEIVFLNLQVDCFAKNKSSCLEILWAIPSTLQLYKNLTPLEIPSWGFSGNFRDSLFVTCSLSIMVVFRTLSMI